MYKLCLFVPESHLETVKTALFEAGAGNIGHYDCCCWQTLGQGQFRPLPGSQPHIGTTEQLQGQEIPGPVEHVSEYRVEMVVDDELIAPVIKALKLSHPYETPAYDVWQLAEI